MWSVGVLAYVALSGRMPFFGDSSRALEASVVAGRYAFERRWWGAVSPGWVPGWLADWLAAAAPCCCLVCRQRMPR
jgi:hypothetical protein